MNDYKPGSVDIANTRTPVCLLDGRVHALRDVPGKNCPSGIAGKMTSINGMPRSAICEPVDTVEARAAGSARFATFSTLGCCEVLP